MEYKPFVPGDAKVSELTIRAILLGVIMSVILGAANAYLGLKAGLTVAAAFPAAVIAMAALRVFKGSILEENIARTTAAVAEALAAGAIFTIPAFYLSGSWTEFGTMRHYCEATAIMMVGGVLGVLFVTILRKVMVEEATLPFPEAVAVTEIHKAGRTGGTGAVLLFGSMLLGGGIQLLAAMKLFATSWGKFLEFGKSGITFIIGEKTKTIGGGGGFYASTFGVSPALYAVGYIIGPRLSSVTFAGGLLAWGLFVPLMLFIHGNSFAEIAITGDDWVTMSELVWRQIVRPIAVGGMLGGAAYTMFRMRKQLAAGLGRAVGDVTKAAHLKAAPVRIDKDLNFKLIFFLVGIFFIGMIGLYNYFIGNILGAVVAAVIMVVAGFFFSAVSGYLVGLIGSSNNPISGLTLSSLILAALVMLLLGITGTPGIIGTLAVAAVVCCMCGVAGDMTQDFKIGYFLGATPWKMEIAEIIGVIVAALVLFIPLAILHDGYGFGSKAIPAPQAGLMAMLAKGIVGGAMAWPLVIVGLFITLGLVLIQAPSPMLIAVGMYLPLESTFAIFIGGIIKWVLDTIIAKKKLGDEDKMAIENKGVLLASGLIAGEALVGLLIAGLTIGNIALPQIFEKPLFLAGLLVTAALAYFMIKVPLKARASK